MFATALGEIPQVIHKLIIYWPVLRKSPTTIETAIKNTFNSMFTAELRPMFLRFVPACMKRKYQIASQIVNADSDDVDLIQWRMYVCKGMSARLQISIQN